MIRSFLPPNQMDVGLEVSPDSYIRLPASKLMTLAFSHHLSGLDETMDCDGFEGATLASISGYTELLTDLAPVITVGWDWRFICSINGNRYFRDGMPRTNLMLVDQESGSDLGEAQTLIFLMGLIDSNFWNYDIGKFIDQRY